MKVLIFEKEHFEGAFPVIRLFDQPGTEIVVATSADTHRRFLDLLGSAANRYRWIILPTSGKWAFFRSLYYHLRRERPDLLYVNTISDNHLLYAWAIRMGRLPRTLMTVHDINCLFESKPGSGFRSRVIHHGKKQLIRVLDEFNVVSDTMLPLLAQYAGGKPLHNVPGAVYEDRQHRQPIGDRLRIVIPGSLDRRRRDYEQVFELARLANKVQLALDLVLLGGPMDEYGRTILQKLENWPAGSCRLKGFKETVVDQAIFDQHLDEAHFVWIPSVVHTRICGDIPEEYGISKSSGNIFDVIKHARPFIVPATLTIPANLREAAFATSSMEALSQFFQQLLQQPAGYAPWEEKALEAARHYSIEATRRRNTALFG